jgi:uncharacterized protein (DUF2267 family)
MAAIRSTLETLAERLSGDEAKDLAAQLPREVAVYMADAGEAKRFSLEDFFEKVAQREPADLPDATYHAQAIMEVLAECVSAGEMGDVREQLPADWRPLFAGSRG